MVGINPVWQPVSSAAVKFLAEPISGNPGDLTWGAILAVFMVISVIYVAIGGKI